MLYSRCFLFHSPFILCMDCTSSFIALACASLSGGLICGAVLLRHLAAGGGSCFGVVAGFIRIGVDGASFINGNGDAGTCAGGNGGHGRGNGGPIELLAKFGTRSSKPPSKTASKSRASLSCLSARAFDSEASTSAKFCPTSLLLTR